MDLLLNGEIKLACLVVAGELQHVRDREALELGDIQVLNLLALDDPLLTRGQVPEVPDGDCFYAGYISFDLRCKKSIDLSFTLKLGGEL